MLPPPDNSKEFSTPDPPADPGECGPSDAQIASAAAAVASDVKAEATPPIADGMLRLLLFIINIVTTKNNENHFFFFTVKVLHRLWWLISLGLRSLRGAYTRSKTRMPSLQLHGAGSCLSLHR